MKNIQMEILTGDDEVFIANSFIDLVDQLSQQDGFNPLTKRKYMDTLNQRLISVGKEPVPVNTHKDFVFGCVDRGIIERILIKRSE